ncbi:GNAT family N-acetyltransferase [Aliirhizobium terrae]|uniref:GNAT family N-acetyltransferase n=1 Tax=Terrirhizobium terrae TaxID=2926709 RepID=UPI0025770646|nr:GNAT family N-acetyltransferase [Rhizobium sp. CC-CFT758]WJH42317.1 GNAT family N-acetyltransferase [Rhizobium sp. CC-CFT758]
MAAASRVFRSTFDQRLPWLASLHTPDEDRGFWQDHLFSTCEIWGAEQTGELLGVIAYRKEWVEQLYVLPAAQGQGIGMRLLDHAKAANDALSLWTFQRNADARAFYHGQGFAVVAETDGSGNEEREPDLLLSWRRIG